MSKWPVLIKLQHQFASARAAISVHFSSDMGYLPNVSLTDQYTCMMDGLGQSKLEHLRLEATLQEILNLQTQHIIELHVRLIQYTDADQTTQQCVT